MTVTARETFAGLVAMAYAPQLPVGAAPHEILRHVWLSEGFIRDMRALDHAAQVADLAESTGAMRHELGRYAARLAAAARTHDQPHAGPRGETDATCAAGSVSGLGAPGTPGAPHSRQQGGAVPAETGPSASRPAVVWRLAAWLARWLP